MTAEDQDWAADDGNWEDSGCDDCFCCSFGRCNSGPDSDCPTDRLGDSACPCTCE